MPTAPLPRHVEKEALLDEWLEARRQVAVWEAKASAVLARRAELADADAADAPMHRETIRRSMVAEFSSAGRVAKGTVEQSFGDARTLHDEFPDLRDAFEAGTVSAGHVREILRAARPLTQAIHAGTLDDGVRALFEAAALEFATTEAPARTRAHVRELAAALAPQTITDRHEQALDDQYITVRPYDDELSFLSALLPTHIAVAIMDRLTRKATHLREHPEDRTPVLPVDEPDLLPDGTPTDSVIFGVADTFTSDPFTPDEPSVVGSWIPEPGPLEDPEAAAAYDAAVDRMIAAGPQPIQIPADTRSLDRIRAELFTDLLLAATPSEVFGDGLHNITAHVQVTLAATTLTGEDELPAQLDGHGALHPAIARSLAGTATSWTRLFLDPEGFVTQTDTYTPTAAMRRHLRARDQHCRFPGCRMPVHRCELDHTLDWAKGGKTSLDNLAYLCKTHHALKHPDIADEHRWSARQLPDWSIQWTSPTGRTHTDTPPGRVMFVPTGPPGRDPGSSSGAGIDWAPSPEHTPF